MRDYTEKPILCTRFCSISFGSSGGGGSSTQTSNSVQGLLGSEKPQVSQYVEPALKSLYGYATGYLYPPNYAASGVGGGSVPDQSYQSLINRYIPDPSIWSDVSSQTGQAAGTVFADSGGTPFTLDEFKGLLARRGQLPASAVNAATPQTPWQDHTFKLPGLDANGLYAGQTGALDEVLQRAAGGLNTSADGLASGVLANSLPGLFDTIGKQTVSQVEIPEQVRQQRVQDVNAVLQLMSAGLGSSSAGSGSRNFSSSSTNFGFSPQQASSPGATNPYQSGLQNIGAMLF